MRILASMNETLIPGAPPELACAVAASRFLRQWIDRADDSARARFLAEMRRPYAEGSAQTLLTDMLHGAEDDAAQMAGLRRARNLGQAVIAARALGGLASLDETMAATSALADASLRQALDMADQAVRGRFGTPRDAEGKPVCPVVIGMGKLGGGELNFSSDVDLMLFYTAAGESDGERSVANEIWFAKLAQAFTRLLAEQTADGFVYRVDWALRPFGKSGPPAMHFAAAEDYYQAHGREWERYAMIKARPVAGDLAAGRRLLANLRPFVYRRYLDFTAIESLRGLKLRIEEDVVRRGQEENIKVGRGGIREVEFIAQAFQLVRGGQEPCLQTASLRQALRMLAQLGLMPAEAAAGLDAHYEFLRRVENAIQMYGDAQTHSLPDQAEARAALCLAMSEGEEALDWAGLTQRLGQTRSAVHAEFRKVFSDSGRHDASALMTSVVAFWEDGTARADFIRVLEAHGFDPAESVADAVQGVRENPVVRRVGEIRQARLGELVAGMLEDAAGLDAPAKAARRVLDVIECLAGRTPYVSLLLENAVARVQLLRLCAASPWITQMLAQQPMLLDQLLDARALYQPPDRREMGVELQRRLGDLPIDDVEARMNALRRFRQEITLRVAAADCVEALPLPKVSDRLTWLAEVILDATLDAVWDEMVVEYGEPRLADGSRAGFAVIGYGKLGGIEMGYGSDLDVVFLHDCDAADSETVGGRRNVAAAVWYSRFAQRLVHWLSTQTAAGRVYEVDLQLRPSGNAGLLVTSLDSFARYQREHAWTWEHQSLTRARFICGTPAIGEAFERLRREILDRERDAEKLATEIREMREKMRAHMEKRRSGQWDIKQGNGGLTDLEFTVQYLVLANVHHHPALADWPDQWRQVEALVDVGLLPAEEAGAMIAAYRTLRAGLHARALDQVEGLADETAYQAERKVIDTVYRRVLGGPKEQAASNTD
jgi:glutamate-ammonia-ligase adenylyltransferase